MHANYCISIAYMSGVPVNTPKQADEVYKKYMANLAIQAQNYAVSNRQMQAFVETGTTPALPDTTTVDDYFKDIQRLKMDVAKELAKVSNNDVFTANAVVAKLSNEELQYTANDIKRIMDDLSKYKYGLPQPALLNYLKQLYQKYLATNGVSFPAQEPTLKSLVQSINNGRVLNSAPVGLFDPIQTTPVSFSSGNSSAFSKPSSTTSWSTIADSQSSSLSGTPTTWATTVSNSNASTPYSSVAASPSVPSNTPSFSTPPSRINTPSGARRPDGFLAQLNNRLEQLGRSPEAVNAQSDAQIAQESQQIPAVDKAAIDRQYDLETLDGVSWNRIREWWAYWVSQPEYGDTLRRHTPQALIVMRGENKGDHLKYRHPDYNVDIQKDMLMKAFSAWRRQRNGDPETLSVSPMIGMNDDELEEANTNAQQMLTEAQYLEQRRRMNEEANAARQEAYRRQADIEGSGIHKNVRRYPPTLMRGQGINHRPAVSLLKQIAHQQHQHMPAPPGRRISGGSLFPQKKRVSIQVDNTKGLLPTSSTYVPFGKYIISLSHLDKNRLKLRNIHGKSIGKMPEISITSDMSRILKRLIDGGDVDTKDFDTLTLRDKEQLQHLAKEARIADRIHMNEDLTKTDQDINRFTVLQGEIFAGNDNRDLIKEFKMLVIKLAKHGHITQTDAHETLATLSAAGY